MSWGIKIILAFSLFAAGIGSMVFVSFSKNIDLVSENYYDQEIKYQQKIDLIRNSAGFKRDVNISALSDHLNVTIPLKYQNENSVILISFYKNDDADKDFTLQPELRNDGIYEIETSQLRKGVWKIIIQLTNDINGNEEYFLEEKLMIIH